MTSIYITRVSHVQFAESNQFVMKSRTIWLTLRASFLITIVQEIPLYGIIFVVLSGLYGLFIMDSR
jgi:hypothetical protein